ncbi:Glutathione S-transferase [Liberibacter crescens BT-1]|uniref:Glutathione S-transferase n=1 Tax=Liberibacter crescens (strain BT-1) TaxID=1215343 RepID=L0EV36_LIBCB|nr:glutathione transferase GstA [Liberibacter crescens]AGA64827.1 Glutathione S-transferase [Liberibacter crescens BT-1]
MKLYFTPGSCSLAPHIALQESGIHHTITKVDLSTHKLEDNTDYYTINSRGSVPLLVLDNGEQITETAVILQYIADQAPEKKLAPAHGTLARVRLQETLNFIATKLHKGTGLFFNPKVDESTKLLFRQRLRNFHEMMNKKISETGWLIGHQFTVADAYLYVVMRWAIKLDLDISGLDSIADFMKRMKERPMDEAYERKTHGCSCT